METGPQLLGWGTNDVLIPQLFGRIFQNVSVGYTLVTRDAGHVLSEKSQRTQNGTIFVDLD